MAAQLLFFFYIRPFSSSSFLMMYHSFAKLFVPYTCRGEVNRVGSEAERQFFRISTFARTGSAGDKYDSFH